MQSKTYAIIGLILMAIVGLAVAGLATGSVRGRVVNPATGVPVSSASVSIDGRPAEVKAGGFDFRAGPGRHEIVISAPGYESLKLEAVAVPFFGVTMGPIELRDASVVLSIVEDIPGAFPLRVPAAVTIGTSKYTVVGVATLKGIPIGARRVTAAAAGYDSKAATITLVPGQNSVVMTLTPGLTVIASRTADAILHQEYDVLWDLLHPDLQRQYRRNKANYKRDQTLKDAQVMRVPFERVTIDASETVEVFRIEELDTSYPGASLVHATLVAKVFDPNIGEVVDYPVNVRMYFTRLPSGQWRVLGVKRED